MTAQISINKQHLLALFIATFCIRALVFYNYISPAERYKQADSNDYHIGALCLSYGIGMCRPNTKEPLFWRTPGYPVYLVPFYKTFLPKGFQFSDAATAQKASIWFQIVLSSLIPIILLYLALYLTQNLLIAYAIALIAVFHIGLVLTSGYLLTEGIALIPFYLFLYYFYQSFIGILQKNKKSHWITLILLAACMLALYTWIRPMGSYVAIVATIIILLCAQDGWKIKGKKIALFLSCFFLLLSPWYIRNYQYTGYWFFCPMFGSYLTAFCAPRIISTVNNTELIDAWRQLNTHAEIEYKSQKDVYLLTNRVHLPKEFVCSEIAWPIFLAHPWLAFQDWMREVFKTLLDPYSSQLVAFVQGCFFYDPLIEYLSDKVADCLYKTPMPLTMRLIVYLELLYALLLWIGLIAGCVQFMLVPCIKRFAVSTELKQLFGLWLTLTPMIFAVAFMTGGFGYARLRLPVEPLMIILSLTWWYWIYTKPKATV